MANLKDFIKKLDSEVTTIEEQNSALDQIEKTVLEIKQRQELPIEQNAELTELTLLHIQKNKLQQESMAQTVDLIVNALKTIEDKLQTQLNEVQQQIPLKGNTGEKGRDGRDGKDGYDGKDGKDGVDGNDGKNGNDGISVADAKIDFDGSLLITLSDGREIDVGTVLPLDVAKQIYSVSTNGGGTSQSVLDAIANLQTQINAIVGGNGTVTSVAATAGTGISITGSPITTSGTLNITNTAPDQTVAFTNGTGISVTGTYPNFTVTNTSPSSGGTVTSVTGTSPVVSSGGATPAISMPAATTSVDGYLTSTDWTTFNGKGAGTVTSVAATVPSLLSVSGSPITTSGTLAFTYSGTALPVVNGGTGQTTYTNGQLLIGNTTGNTLTKATLTAGAGVAITNSTGSITVAGALAESTSVFVTGTAQTYTAPANTQWVKVTVVGPGGNGGAANNQRATGGGGGGVAIKGLIMSAGQTLTYTVGTASGTASTVSSGTLTITTISGGSGTNGAGTAYAASLTAGPAGGTATGGDVNITGGKGGNSYGSSTTVTTNFSGAGGSCQFGQGGPALALVATAGQVGTGFGAGGGGGHGNNTAVAGTGGIIIFEAY